MRLTSPVNAVPSGRPGVKVGAAYCRTCSRRSGSVGTSGERSVNMPASGSVDEASRAASQLWLSRSSTDGAGRSTRTSLVAVTRSRRWAVRTA
jgi:hypothetical protein